ncbi:hypothetical protein [Hyphococcus luteus]|uniref:PRC-barrel n=1 Tax=Hyphococcus luteus TaxID=2058213 RepID=A0A2S7JZF2_9PROT|nr:hypothetical protein [Marinicaulis flavus]PQA85641.1 hypothetical protein CW354_22185 [Marinicaulis flavus]
MTDVIQWTASLSAIVAASLIAAHISQKVTGIAFIIFTASSLMWVYFGAAENDHGLVVQNVVLTGINLLGIYRYLIRSKPA